jgi:hypothetical protein
MTFENRSSSIPELATTLHGALSDLRFALDLEYYFAVEFI